MDLLFEPEIRKLEQELEEIEKQIASLSATRGALRRSLRTLRLEQERIARPDLFAARERRQNAKQEFRAEQIRAMLEADPNISNTKIASAIGVSPGRVSQIRKAEGMTRPLGSRRPSVDDLEL